MGMGIPFHPPQLWGSPALGDLDSLLSELLPLWQALCGVAFQEIGGTSLVWGKNIWTCCVRARGFLNLVWVDSSWHAGVYLVEACSPSHLVPAR